MSTPGGLDDFFAASPSLRDELAGLARAVRSEAPLLLLGEAGTGRSRLARACHAESRRAGGPLVEVDSQAIPPSLFESEIFGFRAGAFTSAVTGAVGRIERAEAGTLVLDHAEVIPVASQPKLLRVLGSGHYAPLGDRERVADVRFVAIATDDLPARVRSGRFRADLYYRLEVLAFRLSPLRERPTDIAPLADGLLAELAQRQARPVPRLTDRAREWMSRHSWPGNVRELRNVLERALVLAGETEPLDPPPLLGWGSERPPSLAETEAQAIRAALAFTRGHQGRAADLLGISRKALWEKRKRHGLP